MPKLAKSTLMARCDVCRAVFDPVYGGACESCRRLLCSRHFYGSLAQRLKSYLLLGGGRQLCAECRRGVVTPR